MDPVAKDHTQEIPSAGRRSLVGSCASFRDEGSQAFRYNDGDEDDQSLKDDEADFINRLFTTVDAPCRGVSMCHTSFEDKLDLFSHCRQPLDFWSFLRKHNTHNGTGVEMMPAGTYVVPTFCEYCGASHTSQCKPNCGRPPLFFAKKRPPFQKPDSKRWNSETDEEIAPQVSRSVQTTKSWVAGLFGGKGAS